ncbi:MAG: VacB/RNase II family 3'-5' exoribonuclease [Polyangiaceae bacterium]
MRLPISTRFSQGDLVRAVLTPSSDGRWSATSLELVERPRERLFGEVVFRRDAYWLKVDREVANSDWSLDLAGSNVQPGDTVIARIDGSRVVVERKVEANEDTALQRVIARHSLRDEFPQPVLDEATRIGASGHRLGARRDLRAVPTVTVDSASTRDIDDAISVFPASPDGAIRLLVSIADVAEYVEDGSAIDLEARERSTSVYLGKRVLPMIPESLSADALSLLPGRERACLTCEMRIDAEGQVTSVDVYESLICSTTRLTYDEVAAFFDRGEISPAVAMVREVMPWFRTLSARIGIARSRRGGVEVSREETEIVIDSGTGGVAAVAHVRATSAHKMIERFMVAANEAIARWLFERGVPAAFRVHDQPSAQQAAELDAFAHNFGFYAGFGRSISPLALAAFDAQLDGAVCEPAVRSVLLRSLGWARYTVHPSQHYGLAAPLYLHFTSPIRRYADLAVHRTIKRYLRGERAFVPDDPTVESLCTHINRQARLASKAEADRRHMLEAQYLSNKIGESFSARITGVRPFGLQVQIDATFIDGILPFDALPDGPYRADPRSTRAASATRTYEIGMQLTVKVASTDVALGRVEFSL